MDLEAEIAYQALAFMYKCRVKLQGPPQPPFLQRQLIAKARLSQPHPVD